MTEMRNGLPRNDLEERLCEAVCELLDLETVGTKEDLFDLGLNYESCRELVKRFEADRLSKKIVYHFKTIAAISEASKEHRAYRGIDEEQARHHAYPLTSAQMYFIEAQLYAPKKKLINNPFAARIPVGLIEQEWLAATFAHQIAKHPALSTTFTYDEEGNLVQHYEEVIHKVECHEMSEEEYNKTVWGKWVRDLPMLDHLLYYCLIYTTEQYHHILFDAHRAICDERSIYKLYLDVADEISRHVPAKDEYYSYLNSETDVSIYEEKPRQLADLISKIQTGQTSVMPRPDHDSRDSERASFMIEAASTYEAYADSEYARKSSMENLTIAAGLLALSRFNMADDVTVHWICNGRDDSRTKAVVGRLSYGVPVGLEVSKWTKWSDMMNEIDRQRNCGLLNMHDYAYAGSNPGENDICQVEYLEAQPLPDAVYVDNQVSLIENDNHSSLFHILVMKDDHQKRMLFRFAYNAAIYDLKTVKAFAETFRKAFDACCFGSVELFK